MASVVINGGHSGCSSYIRAAIMRNYFYKLLFSYLSLYIFKKDKVVFVNPPTDRLFKKFQQCRVVYTKDKDIKHGSKATIDLDQIAEFDPDFVVVDGYLHYDEDILETLSLLHRHCTSETRLLVVYYNALWKPLLVLASALRLRDKHRNVNWVSPEDIQNFFELSNFQAVRNETRVLLPINIPLISWFVNKYISQLPICNIFNMVNLAVARKLPVQSSMEKLSGASVSIVVAARNEEGHIDEIIRRIPTLGPDDELIFIEGGSTDNTWQKINEAYEQHKDRINMQIAQQDGKGKGDAVRKGFDMAKKEILMILDADLTVPPEDLPKFYHAIVSGKGEFINGSRLVYPMEKKAMRFFNLIGNKFFALAFSNILGQRFKDTLCGTKVITRKNYQKLAEHRSYFGSFDPFGDFDLIFGAARMCLKIIEVPIKYRERSYGDTNISRWRHGVILLRMVAFASKKLKFI